MRSNLIKQYTNILKTIIYLNSVSQSNGTLVESISGLYNQIIKENADTNENENETKKEKQNQNDNMPTSTTTTTSTSRETSSNNEENNKQQKILSVMNYLKFTGFIDYYIDNMKKDKITITISPVISAFLLQYYFEILNVLDNTNNNSAVLKDPKHKEDEKVLLLQKLFVSSSMISPGATSATQSMSIDY